jgi:3-oxoadipate enol-lactonase
MSQTSHVQVGAITFRCQIDGPENTGRPWLVFSNSLMTDLSLWDDQVAAFGGKYRILRYDGPTASQPGVRPSNASAR